MSKKKFNPAEWEETPSAASTQQPQAQEQAVRCSAPVNRDMTASLEEQIAEVTRRIEEAGIDITAGYDNWLSIGFALADALGECGRDYFHRISRFYPQYNQQDADKQYTACVKAGRGAVTVKSFFGRAKDCGISVSFPVEKPQQNFPSPDGSFLFSAKFRRFAITISSKSIVDIFQIAFAIYSEHSKLGSFINQLRISQ